MDATTVSVQLATCNIMSVAINEHMLISDTRRTQSTAGLGIAQANREGVVVCTQAKYRGLKYIKPSSPFTTRSHLVPT